MGFFGAARWGLATEGNLLLNGWGPAGYQGILDILLGGTGTVVSACMRRKWRLQKML